MRTQKFKMQHEKFRREARKQMSTYILAGFGVVAGLAWNEAIKSLIEYFLPPDAGGVVVKFLYAIVVTVLVVVVSVYVKHLLEAPVSDEEITDNIISNSIK